MPPGVDFAWLTKLSQLQRLRVQLDVNTEVLLSVESLDALFKILSGLHSLTDVGVCLYTLDQVQKDLNFKSWSLPQLRRLSITSEVSLPCIDAPNLETVCLRTDYVSNGMSLLMSAPKLKTITISQAHLDRDLEGYIDPENFSQQLAQGTWPALTELNCILTNNPFGSLLRALIMPVRSRILRLLVCLVHSDTTCQQILALLHYQRRLETCEIHVRWRTYESDISDAGDIYEDADAKGESKSIVLKDTMSIIGGTLDSTKGIGLGTTRTIMGIEKGTNKRVASLLLPALCSLRLDIADDTLFGSLMLPNLTSLSLINGGVHLSKFSQLFSIAPLLKRLVVGDIDVKDWNPPLKTRLQVLEFTGERESLVPKGECIRLVQASPELVTLRLPKSRGLCDELTRSPICLPWLRTLHVWDLPNVLKQKELLLKLKVILTGLGAAIDYKIRNLPSPASRKRASRVVENCWQKLCARHET